MKNLLSLVLFFCCALVLANGQKIATVDMEKLFEGFYKTGQIDAVLKQQGQVYQDYLNKRMEKVREMDKTFRIEFDRSQNVTLSQEERNKGTEKAEKIANEIKVIQSEMEVYAKTKREDMMTLTQTKRNDLMVEISDTVKKVAMNQGYDFVLDISGRSASNIPVVIYSKTNVDLTLDVLNILNKGNTVKKEEKK